MSEDPAQRPDQGKDSAAKAWLRALQLTSSIAQTPERTFPAAIEQLAETYGDAPALLSDGECLTYRALARRANQYARWALEHGVHKGETVCLLMPNRPEYLAIWLGITKVGGVVALLNTNLVGPSLAHSIRVVKPKHIIAAAELFDSQAAALAGTALCPTMWSHGADSVSGLNIDRELDRYPGDELSVAERRSITIEDQALYIYTSGTTGWPKAAKISHGRIMQWGYWFAGMMDAQSTDRIYDCLPMYHSVGGLQTPAAILLRGGSVVIRDKFSASQFWIDIGRWGCTVFQYIGELCRYLLHSGPSPQEKGHRLRMACGNGLRHDIWRDFQSRFGIPRILEFYAATEGAVSLFNAEGEPGAIGRIPSFLGHRSPVVLVRFDVDREAPVRDENGFCIKCAANEVGEAIGPLQRGTGNVSNRFEGYSDSTASEKKIIRNVFLPGDAWFRTGDLMRKDERGFFYFIDRIGDTFRWKGENVAASEVSEVISAFAGVKHANVFGVRVPAAEGRAGMAALVLERELDLAAFRDHLVSRLPPYARPLFLRVQESMDVTGTFKYSSADLAKDAYNPLVNPEGLYFNHPDLQAFVPVDQGLYNSIQAGLIRL
jgi:fatty-acyl-CoA synthase